MAKQADITPELCRQLLRYDPETGLTYWKQRGPELFLGGLGARSAEWRANNWNSRHSGKLTASWTRNGYKVLPVLGKIHAAHRVVWAIHYGVWPHGQIDHINGDPSDNRIINLRDVSAGENARNKRVRSDSSSGVAGVERTPSKKNPWRAFISIKGRRAHLGVFSSLAEAKMARDNAKLAYGYHPNHGARGGFFIEAEGVR